MKSQRAVYKQIIKWLLALIVSGFGLWFALKGVDMAVVRDSVMGITAPVVLLLVPLSMLIDFSVRTVRWQILLRPFKRVKWRVFFPITAVGFFFNNVLPFRAGEFARVYWTHKKARVSISSCLAVLTVERIFDMLALLALVLWVLIKKSHLFPSLKPVWVLGGMALIGFACVLALARWPGFVCGCLDRTWIPESIKSWAHQFAEGAGSLKKKRNLPLIFVLSLLFWCVNVTVLQYVAHVFSIPLTWIDSAWVWIALCFGVLLPAAPGYVGTYEAACVAALQVLGYPKELALPFVLVLHFMQILATALLGVPCLWLAGLHYERKEEEVVASLQRNPS